MDFVLFLVISALTLSVLATAKNSPYEDSPLLGTHTYNANDVKHVHDIFKQSLVVPKSASSMMTRDMHGVQFTEPGYFSFSTYTSLNCNNSNNIATQANTLLNTCSFSGTGKYTKTLGFTTDGEEGLYAIITSMYTDSQCLKQIGANSTQTYSKTCDTRNLPFFRDRPLVSLLASFTTKLNYPVANTGIINSNYATASGCAKNPMLSSYFRSGLCLGISTLACSGTAVTSTSMRDELACAKPGDLDTLTISISLETCIKEQDRFILLNYEDVSVGNYSTLSCQQGLIMPTVMPSGLKAVSAKSSSYSKRGTIDVLVGAITGASAVLFFLL